MKKIKVALIFGGCSSEHEVSLLSAGAILGQLPRDRYEAVPVGITKSGKWLWCPNAPQGFSDGSWAAAPENEALSLRLDPGSEVFWREAQGAPKPLPVDVIFPVLHGKNGEDGTIQGLFRMAQLPFVGCGTLSSAVCMDKAVTHTMLAAANIEQAHYLWFYADRYIGNPGPAKVIRQKIEARLNFPIFVKPANAGSSVGISKVRSMEDLDAAVEKAAREDDKIVVEEGVSGQEVECAVLGNRDAVASTVGEIGASAEFYDYEDKYVSGASQLYIPARLPEEKIEEIRKIAVRAYRLLGCRGLSRVDFFVRKDGKVLLNEINTLPGFTSVSMYPKLWEASGVPYPELLHRLIRLALEEAGKTQSGE